MVEELYSSPRRKVGYKYENLGKTERMLKFSPEDALFTLNLDHEFIAAYSDDELSKYLLHDFALAEVVLEAQLRLAEVSAVAIGEVLEQRDRVLRSLAKDHPLASSLLAQQLRDSANKEHDLEIALVAAARALGFVAKHVSGSKAPDVVARVIDYPREETVITIEAKSSADVPNLPQLDFGGLRSHMEESGACGCMLVAPDYPGIENPQSEVSLRANQQKVSCWTIDQVAEVVENIEGRHISARQILNIVLKKYMPLDVADAVKKLLSEPSWDQRSLWTALLNHLEKLDKKLTDRKRSVEMIAGSIVYDAEFQNISVEDVRKGLSGLAAASRGGLALEGDTVLLLASVNEIRRRVQSRISSPAQPRRISTLRGDLPAELGDDKTH